MRITRFLLLGPALLLSACTSQNGEDLLAAGGLPTPSCDTSHVTYALSVAPLLQQRCSSCHGSQASGGLNVSSFAQVQAVAKNGQLLGTLSHDPGFSPMPKGGAQLSACELAQLRAWVAAGAPNN